MTPTITSLMKVAAALGKSVCYFIEESDGAAAGDRRPRATSARGCYTSKEGLDLNNISGRYGPFFVAGAEADVEPLGRQRPAADDPPGRGARAPARGRDDVHDRRRSPTSSSAGDSIHFRTAYPHSWANPRDRPARAIWLAIRSS